VRRSQCNNVALPDSFPHALFAHHTVGRNFISWCHVFGHYGHVFGTAVFGIDLQSERDAGSCSELPPFAFVGRQDQRGWFDSWRYLPNPNQRRREAPQNTIDKIPVANRTNRMNTSVLLHQGMLAMSVRYYPVSSYGKYMYF